MIRNSFLLITLQLFAYTCYAQQTNCYQKLKTGKFYYEVNGERINITRTKNKQVESDVSGKSKLILKISWEMIPHIPLLILKISICPVALPKEIGLRAILSDAMAPPIAFAIILISAVMERLILKWESK